MIEKLKRHLLAVASLLIMFTPAVAGVAVVSAADGCVGISNSVAEGANAAIPGEGAGGVNCQADGVNNDAIKNLAEKIVNTFSIIVGAAAVIMIIYGGFRYITSGGESGRVGAAKNALLYAIVGLVIVALAQIIIRFILNQTSTIGEPV